MCLVSALKILCAHLTYLYYYFSLLWFLTTVPNSVVPDHSANFLGGLLSLYFQSAWKVLKEIFATRVRKKELWLRKPSGLGFRPRSAAK